MTLGRPTKYNAEIEKEICDRLSNGESLNHICSNTEMPSRVTVYSWLDDERYQTFLNKYIHARERQAESFVDQCLDISDDNENDSITLVNKDGDEYEKINHDHINRSRLRVDTRLKLAVLLAPKKYKPQSAIEHYGKEGGPIETKSTLEAGPEIQKVIDLLEESITGTEETGDEGDNKT